MSTLPKVLDINTLEFSRFVWLIVVAAPVRFGSFESIWFWIDDLTPDTNSSSSDVVFEILISPGIL